MVTLKPIAGCEVSDHEKLRNVGELLTTLQAECLNLGKCGEPVSRTKRSTHSLGWEGGRSVQASR